MSVTGVASGMGKFLRCRSLVRRAGEFEQGLENSKSAGRIINVDSVGASSFSVFSFRHYCKSVVEQFSDDEYECEFETHTACSSVANIDEWKWKLSLLLHNKQEKEIVSKDEKDRRDFEQIASLARRMGLFSEHYGKVVVASKVPLPTYRPDLDDRRPQREVSIPLGLQRRVESLLQEYLDRTQMNESGFVGVCSLDEGDTVSERLNEDSCIEQTEAQTLDRTVLEKILQRQSWRIRNLQHSWQESPEGQKMLSFRRSLPAYKEKDSLLSAIARNQILVVSGETGCGKTTQLPQYVLESEIGFGRGAFCNIICTQPRRISAIAVAERVATERGEQLGETVGFKVRLEGMRGKSTRLLFCTTGVLLRRLLVDRSLKGVTHVFVDEIHERGMNEDFLLIVLKDLLPQRPDLRIILMSATLNAELFSSFFGGAPMIHIPGFTYPVRAHFLEDILETTGYKLTSFNQVDDYGQERMWKTQKQVLSRKRKNQLTSLVEDALSKSNFEIFSSRTRDSLASWTPDTIGFNLIEAILCHICRKERPGAVLVFMTGWDDINAMRDQLKAHPLLGDPNRVLLLTCHGSMATSEQRLIFEATPPNVRKIVLATNMAEASITINDIVFVVDCGKAKETSYDALNNTPCLLPSWISQASARQRRGRAGRVQPGECFHLYPRCVYDAFSEYQLPELLRTPLHSICLQIKCLQLGSISKFLSSALQPPEPLAVQNAIAFLKMVGALDEKESLTNLGQYLSILPVDPKLGKMLIYGAVFRCLDPVLTIASGLSVRDPFLLPQDKKDVADAARLRFSAKDYSDHMALVRAYEGWKDAERVGSSYEYCWRNFLSPQTMQAINSLRKQFSFLLKDAGLVDADANTCNKLSHNQSLVRAVICAGLFPGIVSVVHTERSMAMKTMDDGQVMLYANSINAREQQIPYPWLVFGDKIKVNTVYIRDSTGVSDSILLLFGGSLSHGNVDGQLKMLEGFLEFFMQPDLAKTYLKLKEELDKLIQRKLQNPTLDIHKVGQHLFLAVQEIVSGDQCDGKFVFGRESKTKISKPDREDPYNRNGQNPKSLLQTLMMRAGHSPPKYKTKQLGTNQFRSLVEFRRMQFIGKVCKFKQLAENDAAVEALGWLTGLSGTNEKQSVPSAHDDEELLQLLTDKLNKTRKRKQKGKGKRRA